jgi:hypothetical protein
VTNSDLRPREIGELLDRSVSFWRANFKALFAIALGFQLVLYALNKVLATTLQDVLESIQSRHVDPLMLLRALGILCVVALGYYWLTTIGQVATSAFVVPNTLGRSTSAGQAVRHALGRIGAMSGAYLLVIFWFGLAFVVASVPMGASAGLAIAHVPGGPIWIILGTILSCFLMLFVFLYGLVRFLLLAPVLAYEPAGSFSSFRRSGALLAGSVGPGVLGRVRVRAAILLTAMGVILLIVGFVAAAPTLIVTAMYSQGGLPTAAARLAVPQAVLVPAELFQVFAQSVFSPLAWVLAAFFYVDMRVRREGLDFELKLAGQTA